MTDYLRDNYKVYKELNCTNLIETECATKFYEQEVWRYIEKTDEVRTLINYGKIVARKNGVSKEKNKMYFIITYENIKPFSLRDSTIKITEDKVYQSPIIPIE